METIKREGFKARELSLNKQIPRVKDGGNLIHPLVIPPVVLLQLDQHLGSPAEPVVAVDDKVLKGQLIAKAKGLVSANIHASTSGTVVAVAQRSIYYDTTKRGTCIVIEADGEDQWIDRNPCRDYQQVSSRDLLSKIRAAGIVDMDGEGLPAHICLSPKKAIDTLIINACQWNNAINTDDVLLLKYAREAVIGLKIVRQILDQPARTVIALENDKEAVAAAVQMAIAQENILNCEVGLYREVDAGPDRQQLIETVTGQSLDDTSLASSVGCVCLNVATVYGIYRAICLDEPAIAQIITVNGEGFNRRQTISVPLGTQLGFILKQQGFQENQGFNIRVNSVHNGSLLLREEAPVNKRLNSLWSIKSTQDIDANQYEALDYLQGLEFFDAQAAKHDDSVNRTNALLATPAIGRDELESNPLSSADDLNGQISDPQIVQNTPSPDQEVIAKAEHSRPEAESENKNADKPGAVDADPNLTLRSQNIMRLQDKLKHTEDKLSEIDPADDDAAEALLLTINVLIEKIQAAKALREEENTAAAAKQANNNTLRGYIGSLRERLAQAQEQFAQADRASVDNQAAVKQALAQLEARLEDALINIKVDH